MVLLLLQKSDQSTIVNCRTGGAVLGPNWVGKAEKRKRREQVQVRVGKPRFTMKMSVSSRQLLLAKSGGAVVLGFCGACTQPVALLIGIGLSPLLKGWGASFRCTLLISCGLCRLCHAGMCRNNFSPLFIVSARSITSLPWEAAWKQPMVRPSVNWTTDRAKL